MTIKTRIVLGTILLVLITFEIRLHDLYFSSKSFLSKINGVKEKAEGFSQEKALKGLEPNRKNGFYYRFDDMIGEAICVEGEDRAMDRDGQQNGTVIIHGRKFNPLKSAGKVKDRSLFFSYTGKDYLYTADLLSVPKDSIGEIEIRMKLDNAKEAIIGWSRDDMIETGFPAQKDGLGAVSIRTIPDKKYHVYNINAKNVFRRRLDFGDTIQRLFLAPNGVESDNLALDYVKMIGKSDRYSSSPFGKTYETIGKEMRSVLYMDTPLTLEFDPVNVPLKNSRFKCGLGVLEDGSPVLFEVMVICDGAGETIFSEEVSGADAWHDVSLSMDKWSGKTITVCLSASSEKGNISFWSNPVIYSDPAERFNIIIVLEDALRPDNMSCYGYERLTTPFKDEFVKKGVVLEHAFAQSTETRTSCPSLMTGLYPTATGVWRFIDMLDDRYLTLAEILRQQGFATAEFIQNGNAGPYAGVHQGFGYIYDYSLVGMTARTMYGEKLKGWITANKDRNFFIYLHHQDPHEPYTPPKEFDLWSKEGYGEEGKGSKPEKKDLYDGEIRANDFYFEKFMEFLENEKLIKDTLIIVMADHGQGLGEHGQWGHHPPGYRQVIHIPMIIYYPHYGLKGLRIPQTVQIIDVMPTILDYAGVKKDDLLLEGESLLPLIGGNNLRFWNKRICVSEEVLYRVDQKMTAWGSLLYKDYHVLTGRNVLSGIGSRVYNFVDDPDEIKELGWFAAGYPLISKIVLWKLKQYNLQIWRAVAGAHEKPIRYDPDTVEQLKALGYMQ